MADPVLHYLGSHSLLMLATASKNGIPHAAPVIYVNDGTTVYFSVAPSSTSASNLAENPVAAGRRRRQPERLERRGGRPARRQRQQAQRRRREAGRGPLHAALLEPRRCRRLRALLQICSRTTCATSTTSRARARRPRRSARRGSRTWCTACFRHLRPDEVDALSSKFSKESFKSGSTLIEQGTVGDRFYLIVDGVARTTNAQGQELSTSGPGGFVGEIAILADRPRTATVTAATDINARLAVEGRLRVGHAGLA